MRNQADPAIALHTDGKGRELLESAAAMFLEKGYDGTSMTDLAESVGLLKPSIYHYVRSKEDLLYAVVRLTHDDNRELLDEASYEATDPLGRLEEFIDKNLRYIAAHPANVATFDLEYRRLSERHRREIVAARIAYREIVTRFVAEAQAAGDVVADVDPKLAAVSILSLLNSVARWYSTGGEWDVDELVACYRRIILSGLRRDERGAA